MNIYGRLQNLMFLPGMRAGILIVILSIAVAASPVYALDLNGTYIHLGINSDGSLVNDAAILGATFPDSPAIEFFVPGTPLEGWAVGVDGTAALANFAPAYTPQIPVTVTNTSTGSTRSALVTGMADFGSGRSLAIRRTIAFSAGDTAVTFRIELTNMGTTMLTNVAFLEGGDPDQGIALGAGFSTHNDIVFDGRFVRAWASGGVFPSGLTVGFGTSDSRSVFSVESAWTQNPYDVINSPVDPGDAVGDSEICIAFNFGTLEVGQTVSAEYHIIFGRTVAEADAKFENICPADALAVAPLEDFYSAGCEGGPFTPSGKDYTLTNIGPSSLSWTATADVAWLDVTPNNGLLLPGESVPVTVSVNGDANSLLAGDYSGSITFTNSTSGIAQTRQASLQVRVAHGEIEVTDSIPPVNDLNMPFGEVIVGLSRTEHITIENTDPAHKIVVTDIILGGGYFEDFNDGLAQDWYEDVDPSWQVVAGEYRAQKATSDFMMANYAAKQWDDLSVQMTCRREGIIYSSASVILRVSSDFDEGVGSGYVFQIVTDGYYSIWKQVAGSWSWLQSWTYSSYISPGTNTLMAVAEGSQLKFFINDTLVWTGSDSTLASGRIGLGGYTDYGDTTHYFDNVRVGKPLTSIQTISDEQLWYNQHSYQGGEPRSAPKNWVPLEYPGEGESRQQAGQSASAVFDEPFRLENLPSLPLLIPPLGNVTFDVVFEPNFAEECESSVVIKSDDDDEPEVTVQLTGKGIPDYLEIIPAQDFGFSGHPGGPFLPTNTSYRLTNKGTININWTVTGPNWLNISLSGSTIKPDETVKITVTPNAQARSKPKGIYSDQLVFADLTTTVQHNRNVILNIYTDPKIWFTPSSVDTTIYQGGSGDKILTIGNGGDGLLNFVLTGKQTGYTPSSMPVTMACEPMIQTEKDAAALAPAKHSISSLAANTSLAGGRLLVRFAPQADRKYPGLAAKNSILTGTGNGRLKTAKIAKEYKLVHGLSLVELPPNITAGEALSVLNNTPGILYAEPNYKLKALSIPNDTRFSELWGMHNTGQSGGTPGADIDAPEAWDIATGSSDIIVAVIDTGVDYTHPDLAANMWVNQAELNGTAGVDDDGNGYVDDIYGYDFYNNDGDPKDDHYHGTHVAGTIGAVGNNGLGVAGVCWNVKIMALKFLNSGGSGYTDDAIECIQYAILMGAKLSSNSWGGGGYSQALKDAIDAAGNANQLFVAAAGNDHGSNNDVYSVYPASYTSDNIIAVLATDRYDNMSSFSNYGPASVDIGAPGSEILSCQPGAGYQYLNGTSMATPHISGAAAMIWSFYPSMSYQEVKNTLLQTVDEIPSLSGKCVSEGRLNLFNAVKEMSVPWMEFAPKSGSVDTGQTSDVTVKFHGDVPPGSYRGQITIASNDPYTPQINVPVTMTVKPPDYFTELFDSGDNDMAYHTLNFVPDGSASYYSLCTSSSSSLPVNPEGGTVLTLGDDGYVQIEIPDKSFNFYGSTYDSFYIGSNGYITFVSGDTHYYELFSDHFVFPRIAALFDDLNPAVGGVISYKQLEDRIAVTFQNVPEFSLNNKNTFQIEMFFDGKIKITFLEIDAVDGLVGLSQGLGVPTYFAENDLSNYFLPCDLDSDCNVNFSDFGILALKWLSGDCGPQNNWCLKSDFQHDGKVNMSDMEIFAEHWLENAVPYSLSCDLDNDHNVDFSDFGILASKWLSNDCGPQNNWCLKSDLQHDGRVNMSDIAIFAEHWLEGALP